MFEFIANLNPPILWPNWLNLNKIPLTNPAEVSSSSLRYFVSLMSICNVGYPSEIISINPSFLHTEAKIFKFPALELITLPPL